MATRAFAFLLITAALSVSATAATGPIMIDPDHPHSFRYQSGERFFPMGDTAYTLVGGPKEVIARYIDVRRAHKFNFIRMFAAANGNWPFGGTPEKPDYTTINEEAMQKLDWLFDYAAGKGMNIDLIIWGYGVVGGEGLWAKQAYQDLWIDTLTTRYKDRTNLLMYTVANEFERYPDGKYSYSPSDVDWAKGVAERIRTIDTIHPIGVHPSHWIAGAKTVLTYNGFAQRLPPVVWPLWENSKVNLNVTQNNEGVQRRIWGKIDGGHSGLTYYPTTWQGVEYPANWTETGWDFEGAGMEDCIADDWAHGKPVLNTEFGYQIEPGTTNPKLVRTKGWIASYTSHQGHQRAATRKKAWKIATAGGYFAAGFTNTWPGEFSLGDIDNFRPENLETLYDFFTTKTEYWKMAPHLELVAAQNSLLATPGSQYVAYFPRGGTNSIQLAAGTYSVEWLHAESGKYYPQPAVTVTDGRRDFTPPNDPQADWVLHLRQAPAAAGGPTAATITLVAAQTTSDEAPAPAATGRDPKRKVVVAALQAGVPRRGMPNMGPEANFNRLADEARKAAASEPRPELICFPEYALSGWRYPAPEVVKGLGEPIPGNGPWYKRYDALAKEVGVPLLGWLVEADGGKLYNAAFILDGRGQFKGKYRKVQANLLEQTKWGMSQGERFQVIELDGVRYGISICADMFFPETVRCNELLGADVVIHISVDDDMGHLVPARAVDSKIPIVMAIYIGGSYAVDADGKLLGKLPAEGAAWKSFTLEPFRSYQRADGNLGGMVDQKKSWQNLRNVGAYGVLTDPTRRPSWTEIFLDKNGKPQTREQIKKRFGGHYDANDPAANND